MPFQAGFKTTKKEDEAWEYYFNHLDKTKKVKKKEKNKMSFFPTGLHKDDDVDYGYSRVKVHKLPKSFTMWGVVNKDGELDKDSDLFHSKREAECLLIGWFWNLDNGKTEYKVSRFDVRIKK